MGSQEDNRATAESVDMHLNMLRGAVAAYGGLVEVASVEQVRCSGCSEGEGHACMWGEGGSPCLPAAALLRRP